MPLRYLLAAALLLLAAPAYASDQCTASASGWACTIATSSGTALTLGYGATYLAIDNESSASDIACTFANGTAALNTAGSFTIPKSTTRTFQYFSGFFLPPGKLNCITGGMSGTAATIFWH